MFRRLRNRLYDRVDKDLKFKVIYLGIRAKLILTDEYLKIDNLKYHYKIILRFGYEKNIFYFTKKENDKEIAIYVISKKSKEIHNQLYQKCLELVEFEEPIIDINSIPDPPTYLPDYLPPDYLPDDLPPDYLPDDLPPDYPDEDEELSQKYEHYPDNIFEPR
jgi:hypothetical protein